ncbi:MAG: class I SAM-dependent methyltransferase [Candidatus Omnitrophica bacterium]|nr:class I SAM-dependent methyltransferase [Candidatus Omnitrophota bacterium]
MPEQYDEYFEAVFRKSNKFTEAEYLDHAKNFDRAYNAYMPKNKDAKILDVGCGGGHFLYYLKDKGYNNFTGIDISAQQVEFCKQKIKTEILNVDAFEFLGQHKEEFDLVASHDVLEHIKKENVIKFLKLIHSALKPGGQVFLRTPNCGNPMSIRLRYADFTHEFCVTEKSFYQILYLSGFRKIEILPSVDKGFLNKIVAKCIRFVLGKLMWYQGFVAPKILTPVIFGIAQKDR